MSESQQRPTVHPVSALADLIERQRRLLEAERGTIPSYSDIARWSSTDLTRGEVQRLATQKVKGLVALHKRRGLALALEVHAVIVDRAIAADLDLWLSPEFNYDYRTDTDLTKRDREEIDRYIETVRGRKKGSRNRSRSV